MQYQGVETAVFLSRPGRFLVEVMRSGQTEICHLKNTGRCKELLLPGTEVYLAEAANKNRKTKYDLIAVRKGETIVNIDSQMPNHVVKEWLKKKLLFRHLKMIKPEMKYGNSRFDFFLEADGCQIFMEVKGVTLADGEIARFPDAPTERGVKHIEELIACKQAGYEAYIIFVIQMKGVTIFEPNDQMQKALGDALRKAHHAGVHILAYDCQVSADSITLDSEIEIRL